MARWWRAKGSRGFGRVRLPVAAGLLCGLVSGCSLDSLLKTDKVPTGTADPAVTKTPQGALAIYQGLLADFRTAFNGVVSSSGMLTDELRVGADMGRYGIIDRTDQRDLPEQAVAGLVFTAGPFTDLQTVRSQAGQAIELLKAYVPEKPDLVGHSYALEGYAELLLAEQFCSGIPLSTVDFDGDYTLRAGSSTEDVFAHAIALFDSALTFTHDSARFVQLATMGKARAQLGLGQFETAAATATSVPDGYRYDVVYPGVGAVFQGNFVNYTAPGYFGLWYASVADREGQNGLDFISSNDPRSAANQQGTGQWGFSVYTPNKYAGDGSTPIILTSAVEARLIQAEADLKAGNVDAWLAKLNALRGGADQLVPDDTIADTLGISRCGNGTLCGHSPGGDDPVEFGQPAGGFSVPSGYGLVDVDTTYPAPSGVSDLCNQRSWYRPCYQGDSMVVYLYVSPAHTGPAQGTGGVAGLAALSDPGAGLSEPAATNARVDVMFRERALWLFLTGHRQGDVRRLVRRYGRTADGILSSGTYPGAELIGGMYGHDVTFPVPAAEQQLNPQYGGCFSRSA